MTSRLHEGITRTQSPPRTGSPLRLAALIALCAAVLLALGWTIFSPTSGTSQHQAQAQTPEPQGGSVGPSGDEEDDASYAAFGDRRSNLFTPVVPPANEEGSEGENNNDEDTDGTGSQTQPAGDEIEDQDRATLDDDNGSRSGDGDDTQQRTTSSAPPPNDGAAAGSGAGNVNCQNPEDDFEEILCEEGAPGSGSDRTTSERPGGRGELEDDRDGGSGRSGAGEPTDTFRNGGPAPGK